MILVVAAPACASTDRASGGSGTNPLFAQVQDEMD